MKENIRRIISTQINYYKSKIGKDDFSKTIEEHKERSFLEGTIFGLEQALISVDRG